jgi:hypothetical protein
MRSRHVRPGHMRPAWRPFAALLATSLLAALALPARALAADQKEACFTAYEQGQRLRHRGSLQASREQFAICSADGCPGPVKKDCAQWLGEVQKSLASVIVTARDGQGQETTNVEVFVDDQRVAQRLDGKPISIDPGSHTMRYVLGDQKREEKIFLGEGEQRRITADFVDSAARSGSETTPAKRVEAPEQPRSAGVPTATIVLGAVAAVGLASFATFGIAGKVVQGCSPTCQQSSISAMRLDYAIADVSLLVGLAAAGGAVYFLLSKPSPAAGTGASTIWLRVGPTAWGGAALEGGARF